MSLKEFRGMISKGWDVQEGVPKKVETWVKSWRKVWQGGKQPSI